MIMDEYRRAIHPEVEEYMRRYVMDEQDSDLEQVDDEDCWGMNYTGPTMDIKDKSSPSSTGEFSQRNNRLSRNNRNQREKGSLSHAHLETPEPSYIGTWRTRTS